MKKFTKKGFTLAEVMVALLVIAVILAASTPIITKRTIRTRGGKGNNPWEWVGNTTNAVFNREGRNVTAIIGSGTIPVEVVEEYETPPPLPRLAINSDGVANHISFYQNAQKKGSITVSDKGLFLGKFSSSNNSEISNAVVLGNVTGYNSNSVAIGSNVSASGVNSIAIGSNGAVASGNNAIAIGYKAIANSANSIAIGYYTNAAAEGAIAVGPYAVASGINSLAMGDNATAASNDSYVIGKESTTSVQNTILISHGTTASGITAGEIDPIGGIGHSFEPKIAISYPNSVILGGPNMNVAFMGTTYSPHTLSANEIIVNDLYCSNPVQSSDSRLKNVGGEYTSGMDKINQLKVYNYTFKNDPKNKRVGVVAQELIKIFPNAVSKDNEGYYTIRQEDIFYAMVNAIKELNKKISDIIVSLKNPSEKSVALTNKVSELETQIKQQKSDIRNLKRRIWILKLRTICLK
ncbi:tail fiber domain-containing protein [bacterium]|nr:tail fiber domain-containing protein [bacterium]